MEICKIELENGKEESLQLFWVAKNKVKLYVQKIEESSDTWCKRF